MKTYRKEQKRLRKQKQRIHKRLREARNRVNDDQTAIRSGNINYEIADKARGISAGGIGAIGTQPCRRSSSITINHNRCLMVEGRNSGSKW